MFLGASFSKANPRSINRHLDIPAYYDIILYENMPTNENIYLHCF